ncbi:transcriptional regulator [Pasteurellaceae bacterium Macca]|nr:transcriptional regulator [Pasteurellaceae bacterium Macca]
MSKENLKIGKQIGQTIAFYRQRMGLTQEELAEKLEIGNEAISRIERGVVIPSVPRLVEFADIFHCNTADLLVKSSSRHQDQAEYLLFLLNKVKESDRVLILEVVEKLVSHLANKEM